MDILIFGHGGARVLVFPTSMGRSIRRIVRDDSMHWTNERFSQSLWQKGIPHAFRVWNEWAHD